MPGSLGFGELLVIVLVALLIFGPKKLPEIGRTVGKGLREFRKAASDLQAEIEDDVEAEPPTDKTQWQRRRDSTDPADRTPDDGATTPGADPRTGDSPD